MKRDEAGTRSIAMDTNILHKGLIPLSVSDSQPQDHIVPGLFPLPWTLGEAMNHNYLCAQATNNAIAVANSDEFWNVQPMRGIRDFTPYAQISSTQASNHIVDAITDNYSSNPTSSSFNNHGFESLPFSSSNRWDFNNFGTAIHDQCSEMSSSGHNSYSLRKRQSGHASSSSSNHSLSFDSHSEPLQISSLLSGSKFFHAMQEILAEIACYALGNFDGTFYSSTGIYIEGVDQERVVEAKKKKNLLALLQVVDERYNQCLDEIHTVISAFHAVTELDPNLHARFALPTISFMYKNLRERISGHILAMGSHLDDSSKGEDNVLETCFLQKQWALQQLRKRSDHQLWRPQRGLPERSVSVLRAWMFQNFLHPYPKDADKHLLALKSGLTRSQVSNWFINARVRLWKPMIEEMYAEMNRRKARRNEEEDGIHLRNHMRFENGRFTMD